jgi:hypothetical protein
MTTASEWAALPKLTTNIDATDEILVRNAVGGASSVGRSTLAELAGADAFTGAFLPTTARTIAYGNTGSAATANFTSAEVVTMTMDQSTTISVVCPAGSGVKKLYLTQPAGQSYFPSWNSAIVWAGGIYPMVPLNPASAAVTAFDIWSPDGTTVYISGGTEVMPGLDPVAAGCTHAWLPHRTMLENLTAFAANLATITPVVGGVNLARGTVGPTSMTPSVPSGAAPLPDDGLRRVALNLDIATAQLSLALSLPQTGFALSFAYRQMATGDNTTVFSAQGANFAFSPKSGTAGKSYVFAAGAYRDYTPPVTLNVSGAGTDPWHVITFQVAAAGAVTFRADGVVVPPDAAAPVWPAGVTGVTWNVETGGLYGGMARANVMLGPVALTVAAGGVPSASKLLGIERRLAHLVGRTL